MKKTISALGFAVLALAFTNCAGKSKEQANEVRIAFTTPLTGDYAEYGVHFKNAATLSLERINAEGGINGKPLVIDFYDTKADPKENAELARKITQDERYVMALGDFTTSSCMAAAPIYEDAGMVYLSPTASNPAFAEMGEYLFAMYGTQADDAPYVAQYIIQKYLGAKSAGLIYLNTDWGHSALRFFKEKAAEIGLTVTAEEPISEGEKDFKAIIAKLRRGNPDVLYIMANASEAANAIIQARTSGWDLPVIPSSSAVTDQLITMLGAYADGILTNQVYNLSPDDKAVWDFSIQFKERAGVPMVYFSLLAYDAVWAVSEAARACGDDLSRKSFRDKLAAINIQTLLGNYKFDESGKIRRVYKIVGYKDGGWAEIKGYNYINE
ncbi:MAG: ABC transporter substrate-binding protein [Spirochaetaceae bacterium]|jgi:branched-chain amino acid transport system substrate-binding protein|nr:ABC transporter substrate-binding protein [Spirochaetaceae bacterium]